VQTLKTVREKGLHTSHRFPSPADSLNVIFIVIIIITHQNAVHSPFGLFQLENINTTMSESTVGHKGVLVEMCRKYERNMSK